MMAPRAVRRGANDITEIQTFQPRSYAESKEIAATFRHCIPVIINFQDLPNADRPNMLPFILGLKEGLEGTLKRVTGEVFLLGPSTVWVTDEDDDAELSQSNSDDLVIRP
jgi:cell division inhibitor SepF